MKLLPACFNVLLENSWKNTNEVPSDLQGPFTEEIILFKWNGACFKPDLLGGWEGARLVVLLILELVQQAAPSFGKGFIPIALKITRANVALL